MSVFAKTVQKAEGWLRDISEELGCDAHGAERVLRSVLHALRDRLPAEEAVDLGAQLPMVIRGLYYEGWRLARRPMKMNREQFLARVAHDLDSRLAPRPGDAVRAVLAVLARHVTPGEIDDVEQALPHTMRDLWLI